MKILNKLLLTCVCCSSNLILIAQKSDTLEILRNEKGKISFARFKQAPNRKLQESEIFIKGILKAKPEDELRFIKEVTDNIGITHRFYQQYYKGIKVEDAQYSAHGKNGITEIINGDFHEVNNISVSPTLTEEDALKKALKYVGAKKYKWEDLTLENFVKSNTNNLNATYFPKGELVITKDFIVEGKNIMLAWKFTISSLDPNNEQLIYVDAVSGKVIRVTPLILDVNTPCTAQTRYSGTLGITGDSFTGGFRLQENRNGVNIQTLNLGSSFNYGSAIDFANNNTNFTAANWVAFNQDRSALDAHWGAEQVLDYWRVIHNRNSINGSGLRMRGYVHAGVNWNNAQWVGGTNNNFMQYGDNSGMPLTSLDICAHEVGHGITQFTCALSPGTQESGALNEGFSDIWGACIEGWAAPAKQRWLIGEEVFNTGGFNCLRNLQNPKTTTAAEGRHPDTYHGQFWDNGGEPHFNSTVLSHWFFLLAQGGAGTNDIGSVYDVNAIGINSAERIAYRTELLYLTPSSNYQAARNGSIQAARDLFGVGSCEEIAVTRAWFAVGVGGNYITNLSITGDDLVCGTSNIYTVSGVPPGAAVTWTATPAGVVTINNPNSLQTTITKITNGVITLTATISNGCTAGSNGTKPVVIGPQTSTNIAGFNPPIGVSPNEILELDVLESGPSYSYLWEVEGGHIIGYGNQQHATIQVDQCAPNLNNAYINVHVTITNACGTGNVYTEWTTVDCGTGAGGPAFAISPNPAKDNITISGKLKNSNIKEVQIVDKLGNLKKIIKNQVNLKIQTINISGLLPDIYYIKIFDGQKWVTKPLSIQ